LIFGHPTGEVLEDIGRGDAGSEKRRLPAAHAGGDVAVLHCPIRVDLTGNAAYKI
jgi:hypothetical protein